MVALVILTLAVTGCAAVAAYSSWSLRREARGQEIHAHAGGTVHSHHRGSRPHAHPTFVERYDARLARVFGPSPRADNVQTLHDSAAAETADSAS